MSAAGSPCALVQAQIVDMLVALLGLKPAWHLLHSKAAHVPDRPVSNGPARSQAS